MIVTKQKQIIAHVDRNDSTIITCSICDRSQKVLVSRFKHKKHRVKTRCKCGEDFDVQLNFRQNYRKDVKLPGILMVETPNCSPWKKQEVIDLSRTGVRIKLVDLVSIKKGDTVRVQFGLDNDRDQMIDKRITVKHVSGNEIGGEFKDLAFEEKELGFYLFS